MKQNLTKYLKSLGVAFEIIALLFIMIYLSIYLSGIRRLNVYGLKMNFDSISGMAIIVVSWAGSARSRINHRFFSQESKLSFDERKERRRRFRHILWTTWFTIYFPVFTYGQIFYAHLGKADFMDLILVLLYGIIGIDIAIPMPKTTDNELK